MAEDKNLREDYLGWCVWGFFYIRWERKKKAKTKELWRKLIITEQRLYPHSAWYFICGISFHPIKFWKEDSHFTDKETESQKG